MDIIQEAFNEATLDLIERHFNKINSIQSRIDAIPIISCDDVLVIAVPFRHNKTKKRLKSMSSFVDRMKMHDATFNATKYYSEALEKRIDPSDYHALNDKLDYQPVYRIRCKSDSNTIVEYSPNYLFFRFHKLAHFSESRFGAAIRAVIDSDLFAFNSRTDRTDKRIYNTVRNLIIRDFYLSSCEWDFIFAPALSAITNKSLKRMVSDGVKGVRQEKNTFYLYGSSTTDFEVKAYNITANEDARRRNLSPKNLPGDRLKLEINYKRPWFSDHPDLTIRRFTMQNVIADLLNNDNKRLFLAYFFDRLEPVEKRAFQSAAGVKSRSELMNLFSNESSTQVSVDNDRLEIARIKNDIQMLKLTIEQMRSKQDAQDARQDMFEARLNAIDGDYEKHTQKNKLRLVK